MHEHMAEAACWGFDLLVGVSKLYYERRQEKVIEWIMTIDPINGSRANTEKLFESTFSRSAANVHVRSLSPT